MLSVIILNGVMLIVVRLIRHVIKKRVLDTNAGKQLS
jgi:hypothetical protein